MNYEAILERYGGRRSEIIFYLMLSFTAFQSQFDYCTLILTTTEPEFDCANKSDDHYASDQCFYQTNETTITACKNFTYDKTYFTSSLITEFNLVCSRKYLAEWLVILYHMGQVVGNLFGGLGDFIGRKRFILICCVWETLITILTGLLPGLASVFVLRFIRGFSLFIYIQSLALLSELLPSSRRHIYLNAFWAFHSLGYLGAAGVSYLTPNWRLIKLYGVIPNVLYLIYIKFLPESPRWLILRGEKERIKRSIELIAGMSGKKVNYHNEDDFLDNDSQTITRTGNFLDLFRRRKTAIKTLVLCYMQATVYMTYFGLTANAKFISQNILLSMVLQGMVEFPSVFVASFINGYWKRKRSILYTLGPATFLMVLVPFMKQQPNLVDLRIPLIVALIAKFSMRISAVTCDVITSEALPTCVRSVGLTVTNVSAILASCFSIVINGWEKYFYWLPSLIFSVFIITSMIFIALFLPETSKFSLPQTVEDAENMCSSKIKSKVDSEHVPLDKCLSDST